MRKTLAKILCLTLTAMFLLSGIGFAAFWNAKPTIVTTIYPLYEFTKQVVGDKAEVILLVPAGAEPHDWEPAPADLIKVKNAAMIVYNGTGMEPWIDKMANTVLTGKKAVVATGAVSLLPAQYNEEGGPAESGEADPHVWLDPVNAQAIVQAIAVAAAELDPGNAGYYQANAAAYNQQLAALHEEYAAALTPAPRRVFITSHAAFGYLANRYGLRQVAIMGLAPDAEPTPERMVEIIRYVRLAGIKYIFFETLVSPKLAEVIAKETGAQTLVLNPIEGLADEELARGENYLSIMRMNLVNLKYALGVD